MVENSSLLLFQKKRILIQSTQQINHKYPIKQLIHTKAIKFNTFKSIDKSRYAQRTDTVNTVDKSGSTTRTNLYNISTRIEKPIEIDIVRDNKDISDLSLRRDDLAGIAPYIICILRKNKRKKLQKLRLLEKKLFKNQSTLGKGQKRIL